MQFRCNLDQSWRLGTFSVKWWWVVGWEEKGRLKLISAKVEVEAELGKNKTG